MKIILIPANFHIIHLNFTGHHLWGYDLRSDDTPIEANLAFICRKNGTYRGSDVIERQLHDGVKKCIIFLSLEEKIPVWGLEGVYCDGKAVGYLRRADFGHCINKSIGKAVIHSTDNVKDWTVFSKKAFDIDVLGKFYPAKLHLESPLKKN